MLSSRKIGLAVAVALVALVGAAAGASIPLRGVSGMKRFSDQSCGKELAGRQDSGVKSQRALGPIEGRAGAGAQAAPRKMFRRTGSARNGLAEVVGETGDDMFGLAPDKADFLARRRAAAEARGAESLPTVRSSSSYRAPGHGVRSPCGLFNEMQF